jgi:dienelactone hydrolase
MKRALVQQPPGRQSDLNRRAAVRRQRLIASGLLAVVAATALIAILASDGSAPARHRFSSGASASGGASGLASLLSKAKARASSWPFAVGLRVMRFVDATRTITLPNGSAGARVLRTEVFYPAQGAPGAAEIPNARAAGAAGPFPLVVFGHGFNVMPSLYARLLHSWAQAGYVVAAPVFPLENAGAPGGANEADLSNQPADMRFVISRMLASSASGPAPLAGMLDAGAIAVTGQSDGGDTALAVAYDPRFRDRRVSAAVILSGAEIPETGSFTFPAGAPPLLATQGTADTVNPPALTDAFFHAAGRPKYLLRLLGAGHLPPYSDQQPQLLIVSRVTLAFLDGYLKHRRQSLQRLTTLGNVTGRASLIAEP